MRSPEFSKPRGPKLALLSIDFDKQSIRGEQFIVASQGFANFIHIEVSTVLRLTPVISLVRFYP